ncbi:MAG TPA: class I SAM-dependent methyltransferase [Terriglobales bacterium]|nr:class I SAM-dependent methyltransferase [Terriglobales bacterium]
MSSSFPQQFWRALRSWWREQAGEKGAAAATSLLIGNLWTFVRESTPEHRRQRYGDMEYDWEHRVNTTSGTVGWRARLLGLFHSAYQPTDPALFREMMASLPIEFEPFTFVDLGSGKGRTLLMASEYPFRRIVGVELLPALHQIARENLARYKSESQKCFALEAVCGDAANFSLPAEPLVLYLFNPLPESGLRRVIANLDSSLRAHPRAVYVLYHNPLLERVLAGSVVLTKLGGTQKYAIYTFRGNG